MGPFQWYTAKLVQRLPTYALLAPKALPLASCLTAMMSAWLQASCSSDPPGGGALPLGVAQQQCTRLLAQVQLLAALLDDLVQEAQEVGLKVLQHGETGPGVGKVVVLSAEATFQ